MTKKKTQHRHMPQQLPLFNTFEFCIRCDDSFKTPSWCPLCDECYEDTKEVSDVADSA